MFIPISCLLSSTKLFNAIVDGYGKIFVWQFMHGCRLQTTLLQLMNCCWYCTIWRAAVGTECLSPYPSHAHRKSCGYPQRTPYPQNPKILHTHTRTLSFHYKMLILICYLSHWQLATTWCMFYAWCWWQLYKAFDCRILYGLKQTWQSKYSWLLRVFTFLFLN